MARQIFANQATAAKRRVYFQLVDATNGLDAETGEAGGQPQISTNGGAWTNTGIGTLTAIGSGRYYAELTQGAVATVGDIIESRYKSANTAEMPGDQVHVVAYDPDNANSLGLAYLTGDSYARIGAAGAGLTALGDTRIANLDATVSSRLAPTDAGRTLDVSLTGEAGIDWNNIGAPTTAQNLSGTTISTSQAVASVAAATLANGAHGGASATMTLGSGGLVANVTGNLSGSIGSVGSNGISSTSFANDAITAAAIATDALGALELAAGAASEIATAVWAAATRSLTAAVTVDTINSGVITATSIATGALTAAKFAADTGFVPIRTGTAQAGGADTLTLDAGASAVTDFYVGLMVVITGGTGVGQVREATAYNGTTKVLTVGTAFATTPSGTPTFALLAHVPSAGGGGGGATAAQVWSYADRQLTSITAGIIQTGAVVGTEAVGGSRTVAIHVQDTQATPDPIANVQVEVWDSGNTVKQSVKISDTAGNVTFSLNDGSYKIRCIKTGVTFDATTDLTVNGNETLNIEGVVAVISAPSAPSLCMLYGWIVDGGNVAIQSAAVSATVVTPDGSGGWTLGNRAVTTTTDSNGYFTLNLIQGTYTQVVIADANYDQVHLVPLLVSQNISTWS